MKKSDLAQLSTRMFKTNPLRTWLTILGMGVGTGAVVVLVGLGFGLQQIILEQIVFGDSLLSLGVSALGAGNIALDDDVIESFETNTLFKGERLDKILATFGTQELIEDAAPLARFPALITYKGLTGNIFLQGIEPKYLSYAGIATEYGETFLDEDISDTNSVLLSPAILKLFVAETEECDDGCVAEEFIGELVSFRILVPADDGSDDVDEVYVEKEFRVRGITKEEGVLSVFIMMPELRNYVGIEEYDRAQVKVKSNEYLDDAEAALIEEGYRVTALSKTVEQASQIFTGIQVTLAVFGGIALVVSAIGMFNTMTVTLLERTKEIGIMRTIGASPQDIKWLFVSESIVVGFLGGLSGILMGVTFGLVVNFLLNLLASAYGGQSVSLFSFPFDFLSFITLFSAAVGYLTGIFPARRASQLNPLDAIRYE